MPGENTDSWRACWREMESGEAVGEETEVGGGKEAEVSEEEGG